MQQASAQEALNAFRERVQSNPADVEAHYQLGMYYRSAGDLESAARHLGAVASLQPRSAHIHNDLGTIYKKLEKYDEALASYNAALRIDSSMAEAYYNAANVLIEQEKIDEAMEYYNKALKLKPDFAYAWHKLANVYRKREDHERAIEMYQKAIAIQPDFVQPVFSLGLSFQALGRLNPAAAQFQRARELSPNLPKPYIALANVLFELGRYNEAGMITEQGLKVKPDFAPGWARLADILAFQGYAKQAADAYERALQHDPTHDQSRYSLTFIRAMLCDWRFREDDIRTFQDIATKYIENEDEESSVSPLHLNYYAVEHAIHRRVAERHAGKIEKSVAPLRERLAFSHKREPHKRLRIGYLSPDYRTHAVNTILHDMYRHHDREHFEIYAYSTVIPEDNNKYRDSVINGVDHFIDAHPMSHEETAKRIHADEIDILIDLGGYTTHARTEIMALGAAPVQAHYLGYLDTMGAEYIDYIIADEMSLPEYLQPYYTEKFVWLPHAVGCSAIEMSDKQQRRADHNLPEDAFVFCCLNAPYKIDPEVFEIWMRILKAVPDSVLWLQDHTKDKAIKANILKEAAARGIGPERLVFADKIPLAEHNARFRLADLYLDTFVFASGATAVGALASIPILLRAGDRYAARLCAGILASIGMEEMIVETNEEYEERAIYLANHLDELTEITDRLRANAKTHALYDLPRFVRSLEEAYRAMWHTYSNDYPVEHIKVAGNE